MFSVPSTRRTSGYRSVRSVKRRPADNGASTVSKLSATKKMLILVGLVALSMTALLPMIIVEISALKGGDRIRSPMDIKSVIEDSNQAIKDLRNSKKNNDKKPDTSDTNGKHGQVKDKPSQANKEEKKEASKPDVPTPKEAVPKNHGAQTGSGLAVKNDRRILARGVAGLPMSQTPALEGAKWGHVECDVDVDDVAYWNDPQGIRDQNFVSPFGRQAGEENDRRYLTFEPDPGGWNNIRMSMEIIFILAATTGRTLVLPPKAPFYLLGMGKENARSFGSFYDISKASFQKEVEVISMEEFFEREVFAKEADDKKLLDFLTDEEIKQLKENEIPTLCLHREGAENNCEHVFKHLRKAGYQPLLEASINCFVFDKDVFHGQEVTNDLKERVDRFCGEKRTPVYYNQTLHEPDLVHWDGTGVDANKGGHRLLNHFYSFLFFSDPIVDNHYKRFVRDFLHYKDSLYCAAGKVIEALNKEGNVWSTLHVRRGDLQYKEVKISAEQWYENLKEVWYEGETLFIATDERNKTFFDPIKKYHDVRFLDDYWQAANLDELDPYFLSMVDTIVASHGRTFAGTWFSTFTGYINRMRGYIGYSIKDSWYSFLPRKNATREYQYPKGNYGAREWPIGWVAIDGDEIIEHESSPVLEVEGKAVTAAVELKRKVRE